MAARLRRRVGPLTTLRPKHQRRHSVLHSVLVVSPAGSPELVCGPNRTARFQATCARNPRRRRNPQRRAAPPILAGRRRPGFSLTTTSRASIRLAGSWHTEMPSANPSELPTRAFMSRYGSVPGCPGALLEPSADCKLVPGRESDFRPHKRRSPKDLRAIPDPAACATRLSPVSHCTARRKTGRAQGLRLIL